jgi:hypothetical protein
MAKKTNKKEFEHKQKMITTVIACVVLLCVFVTGVVCFVTKAQNDMRYNVSWQNAFARYAGADGKSALDILNDDYNIGLDEKADFGKIVSVIEGTQAAEGFEWAIWLNETRITDRPADQIETKNGDIIVWKIVGIGEENNN